MNERKTVCLGITAHVDAGKTTLCEALLYEAGKIRHAGRVDHKDSTLDIEEFERSRGITAFSKQGYFSWENTDFCIIDTPGHADFIEETGRGLMAPDAAVLVISGSEGVQADTEDLWRFLRNRGLPVWIFVSKMDLQKSDRETLLHDLKSRLSDSVTDFSLEGSELSEKIAENDEGCLEEYLNLGQISDQMIASAIFNRSVFPCFFGSGLRLEGIRQFLNALARWAKTPERLKQFSGICYRISRDARGKRMTAAKISGGQLSVRDTVLYSDRRGHSLQEKVTEIRLYTGARYETVDTVSAGQICCLLGLSETTPGTVLGENNITLHNHVECAMRYELNFREKCDSVTVMKILTELTEELPELRPRQERSGNFSVGLFGRIQGELLKALLLERYDLAVELEGGKPVYLETIGKRVEGIGHFEPLRHYAEVHLILEPLPRGNGITIESICPEDQLSRNWQSLILESLREAVLPGVLTGAELTDIRICLASGKAHPKHTEGGDFREAAYRALRQGLMQGECRLLEPVYSFELKLPSEYLGRAISDLKNMHAVFEVPETEEGWSVLKGKLPVSETGEYTETVLSYTHGKGRMYLRHEGYQDCHNEDAVLAQSNYDPARDLEWPADSVFCSHGAGRIVPWDRVKEYMHLPPVISSEKNWLPSEHQIFRIDERELEEIMLREFGPIRRPTVSSMRNEAVQEEQDFAPITETLIIDGYNYIFSDPELKKLAASSLDSARNVLNDRLSNYAGFRGQEIVLVYDGFRTAGNPGLKETHSGIRLVFTPEGKSADAYIEQIVSEIGKNERVSVVTGDTLIRISAMRSGVLRISPEEFRLELEESEKKLREVLSRSGFQAHAFRLGDIILE